MSNIVKEYIKIAKSLPPALYHLVLINFIMFVGFVCREFTVLYMFGSLLLIVLGTTIVGKMSRLWEAPSSLISDNVKARMQKLKEMFHEAIKYIDARELQSSTINTIITILTVVYLGTIINGTLQIFVFVNLLFCGVFLPRETDNLVSVCKERGRSLLDKISHQ